ncbi:MAG: hypothetical protein QGD93_09295 [Actinomycetota bacterium]|nr:hypothetical protein [Actinomycetota bacterium]
MGILDSAVLLLQAKNYSGTGAWLDESGNGHDARFGSTGGSDTNDPQHLPYDGDQYVYFPGTAGNTVSVPAVVDMDGEKQFDFRYEIKPETHTGFQRPAQENNGVCYLAMNAAALKFFAFDGTDTRTFTSSANVPYSPREWYQIRAVANLTSNPLTVDFFTRDPGSDLAVDTGWVALGAQQTIAATFAGVTLYSQGQFAFGSVKLGEYYQGGIRQLLQMYGAGNTIQVDVDLRNTAQLSEPFSTMVADDGLTWTINRSGGGLYVVDQASFGGHTDDYFEIADHADLDFAANEAFTIMAVIRSSTIGAGNAVLVGKKDDLTTSAGWSLYRATAAATVLIGDGSADDTDAASSLVARTAATVAGVRNISDDDIEAFLDGTGSGSPTADSTMATLANALPLRIGATSGTATSFFDGEIMAVALWRSALTDSEIVEAGDALKGTFQIIGIATETDTALTITPLKPIIQAIGIAVETDTAFAITAYKPIIQVIGLALETNTALTITPLKPIIQLLGIATETDTVFAITPIKPIIFSLGIAIEIDTALPIFVLVPTADISDPRRAFSDDVVGRIYIDGKPGGRVYR